MKLHASVVTYRADLALLERCLRSLLGAVLVARSAYPLTFALDVVINDDEPTCVAKVQALVHGLADEQDYSDCSIATIKGHGNVGYGAAQNLSLARSNGRYHLFLNPDLIIDPAAIAACVRHLEHHPQVALVAPRGFDADGRYARLAKRRPSPTILALRALGVQPSLRGPGRWVRHYTYGDRLPAENPVEIELASGCFMFVRTAAVQAIGGFDERYFLYFEDFDLCRRLAQVGRLQELPDARITHYGGHTARRGVARSYYFLRSGVIFFLSRPRNPPARTADPI